jgi:hypothetical protein
MLAALLNVVCVAQNTFQVDIHNSGIPLPGIVDVMVPTALVKSDVYVLTGPNNFVALGIKGRSFGTADKGVTEITLKSVLWPSGKFTGQLTEYPGQVSSANFVPHWLVGDDPTQLFPSIKVKGREILWNYSRTKAFTSAAKQVFTIFGTTADSPQISARVEITIGFQTPHFTYEGELVYSDLENGTGKFIGLNDPDDIRIRFDEAQLRDRPIQNAFFQRNDPRMRAAASLGFAGRVLAQPRTAEQWCRVFPPEPEVEPVPGSTPTLCEPPDPIPRVSINWHPETGKVYARLKPRHWNGNLLVYGGLSGDKDWALPPDWRNDHSPRQVNKPKQPGDRDAFGLLAGQEAFYCDQDKLEILLDGAYKEALRQIHHRTADGMPIRIKDIANVEIYNSLPDPRRGAREMLSFQYGTPIHEGDLQAQDQAHMCHNYTIVAAALTGSAVARWTLEDQAQMIIGSLDWYVSSQRGVGRVLQTAAYMHCLLGTPRDDSVRSDLRDFVRKHVRAAKNRIDSYGVPITSEVFPGYVDGTYSSYVQTPKSWSPFQQGLMSMGYLAWMHVNPSVITSVEGAWEQQLRIAESVVLHGFYDDPDVPNVRQPYYVVGWREDGKPIANPTDGVNVAYAGSKRLFRLTIANAAYITKYLNPDAKREAVEAATKLLSNEPLIDWDAVRWIGPLMTEPIEPPPDPTPDPEPEPEPDPDPTPDPEPEPDPDPEPPSEEWPALSSKAWARTWAGELGENIVLSATGNREYVTLAWDLTGNGNNFVHDGRGGKMAGYRKGVTIDGWETDLPLLGIHRWADGTDHFGSVYYNHKPMVATGPFYLVAVMTETREGGVRDIFGTDEGNYAALDQSNGDVYLAIGGGNRVRIGRGVDTGAIVFAIGRDADGRIIVHSNGSEKGTGANLGGTLALNGFGYDQTGTSYFDDYLMELVYFDHLPSREDINTLTNHLKSRWKIR